MSRGIQVDAELVAGRLARLNLVPGRSKRQHLCLDALDVLDGEIDVELLRPLPRGPRGRHVIESLLERHALAVDDQRLPVIIIDRDLTAQQSAVERSERTRLGAVEDNRAKAGQRGAHGRSLTLTTERWS